MLGLDRATSPVLAGLYAAKVEKIEDDDHLGRIQVSIPSVFDQTKAENFAWARPCFPYGHFYVPRVGDFVWVAFENGDPSAPVWLGIWYPPKKTPSGADEKKVIVQDSSGNRIEMSGDAFVITCKSDLTIDASGKNVVIKAASVDVKKAM